MKQEAVGAVRLLGIPAVCGWEHVKDPTFQASGAAVPDSGRAGEQQA